MDLLRHLRVTYGAAFAEQVVAALRVKRDEARKILAGERAPLSSPGPRARVGVRDGGLRRANGNDGVALLGT